MPSSSADVPADYSAAVDRAVLRLYSDAQLSADWLNVQLQGGSEWTWPVQAVADGLHVGLAIDTGPVYTRVTASDLDRWGVDLPTMLGEALRHSVLARALDVVLLDPQGSGGLQIIEDEIAIPGVFVHPDLVTSVVGGARPVVLPFDRGHCLVAAEGDTRAFQLMYGFAAANMRNAETIIHAVTPQMWDGQRWWRMAWQQLGISTAQESFLNALWAGYAYSRQRTLLQQLYERQGVDTLVANLQTYQAADGSGITSAVWVGDACRPESPDGEALPVADLVMFVPPGAPGSDRPLVQVTWPAVQSSFGHLMEPMGMTPERYRVHDFPTHDQLASVGRIVS